MLLISGAHAVNRFNIRKGGGALANSPDAAEFLTGESTESNLEKVPFGACLVAGCFLVGSCDAAWVRNALRGPKPGELSLHAVAPIDDASARRRQSSGNKSRTTV